MYPQRVTLLTVPAHSISQARYGKGRLLRYDMIVGIEVGGDSVTFRHPDYELTVAPEAKPVYQQLMLPQLMAARLIAFARACFVPAYQNYDSTGFALYVSGLQATPAHQSFGGLRINSLEVPGVQEFGYHIIATEANEVLHACIGLSDQRVLSVHGLRGPFGIAPIGDLMYAYGGTLLARLSTVSM